MSRSFDYSQLTLEQRLAVHDDLGAGTKKHREAYPELFSLLDYNPDLYPSHLLETVTLEPEETTPEAVLMIGKVAAAEMTDCFLDTLSKNSDFVNDIQKSAINENRNVVFAGNHSTIIDIAVFAGAWLLQGEFEETQKRNGIVASRGTTAMGVFGKAGAEVMQAVGRVYLSLPRTKTIEKLDLPQGLVDANNSEMRGSVKANKNSGWNYLHLSISGGTDIYTYDENGNIVGVQLGKANRLGTFDIVKDSDVYPVAFWNDSEPKLMLGDQITINKANDIYDIQEWHRSAIHYMSGIPLANIVVR